MIDPITLEVIHHRLESITDEMENALLKSAFSTIVKEGRDATAAVFDVQGRTTAQACAIPLHMGTLMGSVPQILDAFLVSEMGEGDVYLANDPYSGGTHLPDITVVIPVIYQGEVIALSCSMVHHIDMGAISPGVPTSATSIYQEGLNLPPLKFYDAGKPVKVVHDIIRKNVRFPEQVIGDIRAQIAAGNVGRLRMLELFEECGKDLVLPAMNQLLDHSETLTRQALERIPDGSYSFTDYMDNDGIDLDRPIKIQVTVTIKGSEFIVDFTGSSPQVKGPFNCTPSAPRAVVSYALRVITDPSIPTNDGCFRPITLILPAGSIVNCRFPAALGCRANTTRKMWDVLLGALIKAVPERLLAAPSGGALLVYFGGNDPLTGRDYITNEISIGGIGGRPTKDGVDAVMSDLNNLRNVPVEALEMGFPLRVLGVRLLEDSGGAGEYRGGLGLEKIIELLRGSASVAYRGERFYTRPWGVFGGLPGPSARAFVVRKTGEKEEIPSKWDFTLTEGDRLHIVLPGGGGYGDPLKRKPGLVLRDVLDRRISLEAAACDYGAVIDKESRTLDLEKTSALRKEKVVQRGPITWTYDRGPAGGRE